MSQFRENLWTDRKTDKDGQKDKWKDWQKDGQTLFYRTLPVEARGSITD